MFELFVVGTFWFWALVIVEILLLFVFVNYENGIGATISLLAFGACLQWFGGVDILGYITSSPLVILLGLAAYLTGGVTWGISRWYLFCRDLIRQYNALKAEFLEEHGMPVGTKVVPEELRESWAVRLDANQVNGHLLSDPPKARENKNRITGWMAFWVISIIWYFINDFVKEVFKEMYAFLAGFLQRISDNMFVHVGEDLKGTGKNSARKDRR